MKKLQGTARAEEVGGSEYEFYICCASANYDFSIRYIQIVFCLNILHFSRNLRIIEDMMLTPKSVGAFIYYRYVR